MIYKYHLVNSSGSVFKTLNYSSVMTSVFVETLNMIICQGNSLNYKELYLHDTSVVLKTR